MPRITTVASQIVAASKPVLCLDTCDILEIVQCLVYEKLGQPRSVGCVETARRLIDALAANPGCVQLVVTQLIVTEWDQNIGGIRAKAEEHLRHVDEAFERLYDVAGHTGTTLGAPVPSLAATSLIADLVALSEAVLNAAIRLNIDDQCVRRAVQRVRFKQRPSHEGHIKDSIHFEHYLELARQLRAAGFPGRGLFVSGNRKDFSDGTTSRIHPLLAPEINNPAVQIQFFPSIHAAMGYLHI